MANFSWHYFFVKVLLLTQKNDQPISSQWSLLDYAVFRVYRKRTILTLNGLKHDMVIQYIIIFVCFCFSFVFFNIRFNQADKNVNLNLFKVMLPPFREETRQLFFYGKSVQWFLYDSNSGFNGLKGYTQRTFISSKSTIVTLEKSVAKHNQS